MSTTIAKLVASAFAALTFTITAGVAHSQSAPLVDTSNVVSAENNFGFALLKNLAAKDATGNVFISPTSIHLALSMLSDGAAGGTKAQFARTLGLDTLTRPQIDAANQSLMQSLTAVNGSTASVQIANSLWARDGVAFEPTFLADAATSYGAQITALDFTSPDAPTRINQWASDHTNGKIKTIVGRIDPRTFLFLVNAVHFKDQWANQFAAYNTKPGNFKNGSGAVETAQLMGRSGMMAYGESDHYQAVSLPFVGDYDMVIVLPKESDSVSELVSGADSDSWSELKSSLKVRSGSLTLPRTNLDFSASLNDSLKGLGIRDAFDPETADFSAMTHSVSHPYVSSVVHKTYLDIDENGAEAAAVTAIKMAGMAMRVDPEPTFEMRVDHPFLCAIVSRSTGAMLFVGEVNDPFGK